MKKLIELIARNGCGDFVPLLILEEEKVFEADMSIEELVNLFEGKILKIEGEKCLFIPENVSPRVLQIIERNEKFKRCWNKADLWELEGKKGKIFIIREV